MAEAAGQARRAPCRSRPVDLGSFTREIDEALAAFGRDVSYAVQMARSAVTITNKRRVWQARRDLHAAEARAHNTCRDHEAFDCHATAPCGTGDCKFAEGDMARLDLPPTPGRTRRPQQRNTGDYSLDPAIGVLAELRG